MEPEPDNPEAPIRDAMDQDDNELEFENSARVVNTDNEEEPRSANRSGQRTPVKVPEIKLREDLEQFHEETEENIDDLGTRKAIFALFWMSTMFLNIDTGVIPTAQLLMEDNLNITKGQIAFLAGISYLATGLASLFVSSTMQKFTAKNVLIVSALGNAISCFIFAYNDRYLWLCISRFVLGIFQAFFYSYAPVWINHFAPRKSQATWISIQQSFTMLGGILGYIIGSFAADHEGTWVEQYFSWHTAFASQGVAMLVISGLFCFFPNHKIDILRDTEDYDAAVERRNLIAGMVSPTTSMKSPKLEKKELTYSILEQIPMINEVFKLLSNKMYMLITATVTVVMFSCAGLQFWTISYMQVVMKVKPLTAQVCFVVTVITATLPGALTGSWIADSYGGYKGKAQKTALAILVGFSTLNIPFAGGLSYTTSIYTFVPGLWFLLFLGACVVPTCYGIMVSSVPRKLQSASSAFGQIFFNIFGFFAAPILSGYVIDLYDDPVRGLTWGYRLILWSNVFAFIFLAIALCIASYRVYKGEAKEGRRLERKRRSESEAQPGEVIQSPAISETSSQVSHHSDGYSRDELKHHIMRRRVKSFTIVK